MGSTKQAFTSPTGFVFHTPNWLRESMSLLENMEKVSVVGKEAIDSLEKAV